MKRPDSIPEIGAVYGLRKADLELFTSNDDYDVYLVWLSAVSADPDIGNMSGRVAALWSSSAFYMRQLPREGAVVCSTILRPERVGVVVGYFIESGFLGVELDVEGQQELTLLFGGEIVPTK